MIATNLMQWVCRCADCKCIFSSFKNDDICCMCNAKPDLINEDEGNTKIVNEGLSK